MITIISGTNRPGSNSRKIANIYQNMLGKKEISSQVLSLEDIPADFTFSEMYGKGTDSYRNLISKYIEGVSKFVFVVPEYNGSFPGILKAFIDSVHPQNFGGKKAALVGLSSGKAGNLKGMSDLTGILHYLQVEVLSKKPKLSGIEELMDEKGGLVDEVSQKALEEQAKIFLTF